MNPRGLFVTLEGPDGSGKSTQAARLVARLHELGVAVVACRDPGGTALGERLREILLHRADTPLGMRAEMLLYMASRAQLVEEIIEPALAAGKVVVSDRYLLSNVAYQGSAGGLPIDAVWAVGEVATARVLPDLTILLDLPPDIALARTGPARDRIEQRPASYREAVRRGFQDQAAHYPGRILRIDGTAPADQVFAQIEQEVRNALRQRQGA